MRPNQSKHQYSPFFGPPANFRSGATLSRRAALLAAAAPPRDELLELDEYDEPLSEPLESEEPVNRIHVSVKIPYALNMDGICVPDPDELERRFRARPLSATAADDEPDGLPPLLRC